MTAETINQVIEFIYTASTYDAVIMNLIYNSPFNMEYFQDLKQDLYGYLLETPERTVELFNKGQLKWWFVAICQKQIQSTKSKIYGRYLLRQKNEYELFDETDQLNEEEEIDTHHNQSYCPDLEEEIDRRNKYNYVVAIINKYIDTSADLKRNLSIYKYYYLDDLTIKEISDKTGISQSTVWDYLNSARLFLQTKIDLSLFTDYDNDNTDTDN